ncbi:hypothetical protein M404DRAFT_1001539, partial [Pisolithus tinctorius Marx 270]
RLSSSLLLAPNILNQIIVTSDRNERRYTPAHVNTAKYGTTMYKFAARRSNSTDR